MNDDLLVIAGEFIQYGREHGCHGLIDICVDPDDGYFNVRLDKGVLTRLDSTHEITYRSLKETDTTDEE